MLLRDAQEIICVAAACSGGFLTVFFAIVAWVGLTLDLVVPVAVETTKDLGHSDGVVYSNLKKLSVHLAMT